MRAVGIVAEYNPFHNGHLYHLTQAKQLTGCDYSVAVMSGNFVQRGESALFDKFTRAKLAVDCGVDLILEIPPANAVASAEFFARGAVSVLEATGIIDSLCFGSEGGDLPALKGIAQKLAAPETAEMIRQEMKNGSPVFKAMQAVAPCYPSTPNDILGIEYLKALELLKSNIKPCIVKRTGTGYHDIEAAGDIASASAIRQMLQEEKDIIPFLPFQKLPCPPVFEMEIETALLYALRIKTPEEFKQYADVSEGLENKLFDAAQGFGTIEEIIHAVKSKRYSYTRIRRILYNIFLDIPKHMREKEPEFIRVLAFNRKGQELLNRMKKTASLPIINCYTKKDIYQYETAKLDIKENSLYSLALKGRKVAQGGLRAIKAEV